jgi:peroxiredoxin/mono/diheme cytochrome c family protein
MKLNCRIAAIVIVLAAVPCTAAEPPTIAPFTLPDGHGKSVSPLDSDGKKAVVVLFLGTQCPINNGYMPLLVEMAQQYKDKGVDFYGINSNQQDTASDIATHAKTHELPFPVLKDDKNVIADRFGAKRVPEAYLLDPKGKVLYHGRIDDQFGINFKRSAPTRRDLALAIDEFLAGKPVSVPSTEVVGCLISKVAEQPKKTSSPTVTYNGQVAAILERRCVECHRPGQIGPMSLQSWQSASAWAGSIEEAVKDNRMPPWHAGPGFGPFSNDRRLTTEERQTLLTWIDEGCPRGEGEAPKGREFVEGWSIGKPDVVFEMNRPFEVPAKAGKLGIPYLYFSVETKFDEDKWIQAAQVRPGAREVVHHVIVYVVKPGERRAAGDDGIGNGFLVSFTPGDKPFISQPGFAKKIPKGSRLVFQMHYTPNGRAMPDRTAVGLVFAKQPSLEVRTRSIATRRFAIPPGDDNYRVDSKTTIREDSLLLSLSPHMHLRGKDFEFRAVFPDGKSKTLLAIPHYDFAWQTTYRLAKPLELPAGTRIECTAHFDNSEKNLNNPDPSKRVTWGDQTWDEMMIGFVDYVPNKEKKSEK